ncbi:MarR family winged helix-turn-helix transcriptional regulator [Promicromonospora sp. NFX87]|uniref:MarR family winged helix-turn-helix transcriptional regulator n=1 Tax=Promicromonospora sp. NFX87 TaxID=3402691 RepID=UPI003AFA6712
MVSELKPPDPPEPSALDPKQETARQTELEDHETDQVVRVLQGLRNWRKAERRLSEASRRHMELGQTDIRTLRFVIAAQNRAQTVTPGAIATHLGITSASTTKLLHRLARAGHIRRLPHPSDRRSLIIEVTEETRRVALHTVGADHGRRFEAAARLSPVEREIVARFLDDLANMGDET